MSHILRPVRMTNLVTLLSVSSASTITTNALRTTRHRTDGLRLPNSPIAPSSDPQNNQSLHDKISRNQQKRALKWAMELASFSKPQLKRILKAVSLEEDVLDAIMLVKRLGPDVREGKRRQFNYIGKLIREVQPEMMDGLIQATKDGDHDMLRSLAASFTVDIEEDDDEDENEEDEEFEDAAEVEEESIPEYFGIASRWFEGLISKDIQITNEVYSVHTVDFDRQELRKLVRNVHSMRELKSTDEAADGKIDVAVEKAKKSRTTMSRHHPIVSQILTLIIQNRPLDSLSQSLEWTPHLVSQVLRSIPQALFETPRSIARQPGSRHRSPLKPQSPHNHLIAHRDPKRAHIGSRKAIDFFFWVESRFNFQHSEFTVRELAIVLAKGNQLNYLWEFLRDMSRRDIVRTETVTCLIKVLGERGMVNQAVSAFYRMKQLKCKPDVNAYNTIIHALCRVGSFRKARFMLEQMELSGFRCPPDTFTYTILIGSYCKYSLQTGCRKAIRRRMWEANHLFRLMLFKGFVPDVVTYNCLIDGCCKTGRIERALELFEDMSTRGCVPNKVTYNSFIRYYSVVNEIDKAIEMMRRMHNLKHGVASTSSYTPVIHALCEAGRVLEARDFLAELVEGGSVPREYAYKFVSDALVSAGMENLVDDNLRKRIENGIEIRRKEVMKWKPVVLQIC